MAAERKKIESEIRSLVKRHGVSYANTANDLLAHHISRLAGDVVVLDEVERMIIAFQRAGHITRSDVVRLTAAYLHESKP